MFYVAIAAMVIVAALAAAMASRKIRKRMVSANRFASAAVPLTAAVLGWVSNAGDSIISGRILDSSAPSANLKVFIDDLNYIVPTIPEDYTKRSLSRDDVDELLKPFQDSREFVELTDEEATALNEIAQSARQVSSGPVSSGRLYSMEDVADFFDPVFSFYYKFAQWEKELKSWSQYLQGGLDRGRELSELIRSFIRTEMYADDNGQIFQAIMSAGDEVPISSEGACIQDTSKEINVNLDNLSGGVGIDWRNYRFFIPYPPDRSSKRYVDERAKKLVEMFRKGCASDLADIFYKVSVIFDKEQEYRGKYITAWNEILKKRMPEKIDATVTISNVGKFDTYIRRDARAAVGVLGGEKIIFDMIGGEVDGSSARDYLPVRSRQANTYRFVATVDSSIQKQIYDAFKSDGDRFYMQIGVVASSGEKEGVIFSAVRPFSVKARTEEKERTKFEFDFCSIALNLKADP